VPGPPVKRLSPLCFRRQRARDARRLRAPRSGRCRVPSAGRGQALRHPYARTPTFPSSFPLCSAAAEPLAPRSHCSTRPPVSTPLRLLLSSTRASPPLPAPRPLPPATGSPLSLVDSGRAPPSSATPRRAPPRATNPCNFLQSSHPLASLVLQDATPAVATHRSPLPTDERHRSTLFAPPHHRPTVPVRPCPLLLARHLPRDPLEISGNKLPPLSHHRATLGWAARPWPSRRFGRPLMADRRAPWALAPGRFQPGTVPEILNIFPIVLNRRN
jgi:hypothetical protein